MELTANDFKEASDIYFIKFLPIRECSICGSQIGYQFSKGAVFFDSNCNCVSFTSPLQKRSWQSFKQYYDHLSEEKQKEINEFFKFK